jgi:hypothetical protein
MPDKLLRHQARLLGDLYRTGALPKDEYISAVLGVDRTLVVRWRSGERQAPMGALPILLSEIEDVDARAEALRVLAAPLGLEVRVPVDDGADATATEMVMSLVSSAGRLADAVADGRIDEAEGAALARTADRLEAVAQQLRALVRRGAP